MSDIDNSAGVPDTPAQVAPVPPGDAASTPASAETAVREGEPQGQEGQEPKPKRDRSAEKRISRLTRDKDAALAEAGYWRGLAEGRSAGQPTPSEPPRPQQANYKSYEEYLDAVTDWKLDRRLEAEKPQRAGPQRPQVDQSQAERAREVLERINEAAEGIEGLEDVGDRLSSASINVSRTMVDFLGETDKPALLADWLVKNPKEANRIAGLTDALAVRALERAEAKLTSPRPAPRTTQAPAPLETVGGSTIASIPPEKMTMEQYAAQWRARQAKR